MSVVEAAAGPQDRRPDRERRLVTYLVVLAALVALISARLDDRIYQRADLEVLNILPVIGVIPRHVRRGSRRGPDTG